MRKLPIRLLWFSFGVTIGVLAVLYSDAIFQPETSVSAGPIFPETNVNELISIHDQADVVAKREELIRFIWGSSGFPSLQPQKIESSIADKRYSRLKNLKQINRLTVEMEWGLTSTAYHFIPTTGNNKLLIYHRGHDGDFADGIELIQFFLEGGFAVIALSMPLELPNNRPIVDLPRVGKVQLAFHEQLKLLEMKNGHPVQLFLTPVTVLLNYAQRFGYDAAYMTGVSGGGWTTTIYAAIDPRINGSYPIAGSLPVHLRADRKRSNTAQRSADWGDYEQTIPELYKITNYLELYVLGSYGENRKQLQILNKYDPCCFEGEAFRSYENVVHHRVESLGSGHFAVYLDTSNRLHDISREALAVMVNDILQLEARSDITAF
jgi:hypothetical protein